MFALLLPDNDALGRIYYMGGFLFISHAIGEIGF